jgi:hypothetical protein
MSELLKPPAIPSAMLNFFSAQPDFAAVIGDITEEFHQRVRSSGARPAKLWFWREAFRNALALTAREILRRPVRTIIVALGCVLAVNFATGLYARYAFDPAHWWVLFLVQLVTAVSLGWTGARLLPGREWALALTYSLASACWAGMGIAVIGHMPAFVIHPSWPLRLLAIWGTALRQGVFWLGCLWIRRQGSPSAPPAPAHNPRA